MTRFIFQLYFSHVWRHKWLVITLFAWMPVLIVLHQVIPPLIAAGILDRLATETVPSDQLWSTFGSDLLLYGALILGMSTIGWRIVIYLIWTLEAKVVRSLNEQMFAHFTRIDMNFHNNSFGGSLVSRTSKLVNSYIRVADTVVFEVTGLITMFIAIGVVLWSRVPAFVIAFYALSIVYIIIATIITRRVRKLSSIEAKKQNIVTGYLADMITNVLTVKSFANAAHEKRRFSEATKDVETATNRLKWAQLHRENFFAFTTSTLSIVALILSVVTVVLYDAEVGVVFLVYTYTLNLTTRLWDFSQRTLRNINKSLGDAEEGARHLQQQPAIKDPAQPQTLRVSSKNAAIAFNDVTFAHEKERLFSKFNLSVQPGEKIGLVGHSGSGKSSLTSLLLRFKDIQAGSITIADIDIRDVTQDDVRRAIAYVPQEPLLFHRSLAENIAYAHPESDEGEIKRAATLAHADEFIAQLPDGYDTLVGERGVKLSGGQRQRVAIARAILKDAPILVLDEATSALDSESEQLIQDALWKLMEGRTAIVIAHRLSTIQKMDRIIVLESGNIVEEGNHKDLLKKNGAYAKLWKHQSGGFIVEE